MLPVSKMCYRSVLILYLQVVSIFSIPLQMQLLQPVTQAQPQVMMHTLQQPIPVQSLHQLKPLKTKTLVKQTWPGTQIPIEEMQRPWVMPTMQQSMQEELMQQIALEQQMLELQHLQEMNLVHSPVPWAQPQPILILLPDEKTDSYDENSLFKNTNEHHNTENELTNDEGYDDEELESVVIDGSNEKQKTRKAILLVPNARFSIGGIISTIPWLPIEINVPDTVVWAWNGITSGISGIISIIGSRLPFRPKPQENANIEPSVKMLLNQLQMKSYNPTMQIFLLPYNGGLPIQMFNL